MTEPLTGLTRMVYLEFPPGPQPEVCAFCVEVGLRFGLAVKSHQGPLITRGQVRRLMDLIHA